MTMPNIAPTMDPARPNRLRKIATEPSVLYGGGSGVPGVQQTKIDPTNDLRSQQITPGSDPRLTTAGAQADKAGSAVSNWGGYTPFQPVAAKDSGNAARLTGQAETSVGSGYVAPTNTSAASGYLAQAAQAAQGGGIGQGATVTAGKVGAGAPVAYGGPDAIAYGADTSGLRNAYTDQLKGLTTAPDRTTLAAQALKLFQDQQAPGREQSFRAVGQKAAALGRVGAGMTTNDLTGLEQDYTRQDNLTARDLALKAAGDTLNDRLNVTGAIQSGYGTLADEDRAGAGFTADAAKTRLGVDQYNNEDQFKRDTYNIDNEFAADRYNNDDDFRRGSLNSDAAFQRSNALRGVSGDALNIAGTARRDGESDRSYGLDRGRFMSDLSDQTYDQERGFRDEARGERDALGDFETRDLTAKRGIFGDMADRESTLFDQGQRTRDEFRGERDFQSDRAQEGIDNDFRRQAFEETLLGNQFDRDQTELQNYNDLGWGYDPNSAYGDVADGYQGQADDAFAGIGSLAGGLGYGSGLGGRSEGFVPGRPDEMGAGGTIDPDNVLSGIKPNVRNPTWYRGGK